MRRSTSKKRGGRKASILKADSEAELISDLNMAGFTFATAPGSDWELADRGGFRHGLGYRLSFKGSGDGKGREGFRWAGHGLRDDKDSGSIPRRSPSPNQDGVRAGLQPDCYCGA